MNNKSNKNNKKNNQDLFQDLQFNITSSIYDYYDEQSNVIYNIQEGNKQKILGELFKLLLVGKVNNTKREKFLKFITNTFKDEAKTETELLKVMNLNIAKDKYYSNEYLYKLGFDKYKIKPVHDNVLTKIIDTKIKGKNYSDRIHKNKNDIAKLLRTDIRKFLNGNAESNKDKIISKINQRYVNNYNVSKRLVDNEIARVQESANTVWRSEHDIKYVTYCATLDNRTCQHCAGLDGKVYRNDEAPSLPSHIRCRCTLLSLIDKDWKPSSRIDNITKETINYTTYKEWYSNNIN